MQLRANPHCGRVYKEKMRAKKNWFPSPNFLYRLILKYDSLDNTTGTIIPRSNHCTTYPQEGPRLDYSLRHYSLVEPPALIIGSNKYILSINPQKRHVPI